MPGFDNVPGWATASGLGFLIFAYKFLWPDIRESLRGRASQWRSESKWIKQLEESRDKAIAERDAIANKYNDLFQNFATVNARFTILEQKFDDSQKQVEVLTSKFEAAEKRAIDSENRAVEAERRAIRLEEMVQRLNDEIHKLTQGMT